VRAPVTRLLVVLCLVAACGASGRQKAIRSSVLVVNELRDSYLVLDKQVQFAIVDTAKTHEDGVKRLDEYEEKTKSIDDAFAAAYRALAIVATAEDAPLPNVFALINKLKPMIDGLVDELVKLKKQAKEIKP